MRQQVVEEAVSVLQSGGVIAYPTEGLVGLGCNPLNEQALQRLLDIKKRPLNKGMILIAADFDQLRSFVDLQPVSAAIRLQMLKDWPGHVTWLLPAAKGLSPYLTGSFETVAVRVTPHPLVAELCRAFGGPITSTSANLSGGAEITSVSMLGDQIRAQLDYVVEADTLGIGSASTIRHYKTGARLR